MESEEARAKEVSRLVKELLDREGAQITAQLRVNEGGVVEPVAVIQLKMKLNENQTAQ